MDSIVCIAYCIHTCHIISCVLACMHSHAASFDVFRLGGISGGDELREAFGD